MEFKKDRTYMFSELMAYGFSKTERHILADCHLYFGENSFEAMLCITPEEFIAIIQTSDNKSGEFEKTCKNWLESADKELFMPDYFPDPVHCKLKELLFLFDKSVLEEDEFGDERVFLFNSKNCID